MDELEILGKRYISTRRAAKDNKYHSDYIGQLIRAGKVEGQKVGRSWYVGADSLADYLGKEAPAKTSTLHVEIPVRAIAVEEKKIEEKTIPIPQEEIAHSVEKKVEIEENYIPVKISQPVEIVKEIQTPKITRGGLRYMADDGPLYPRTERETHSQIKLRRQPVKEVEEEVVFVEQEPVTLIERPKAKKNIKRFFVRGGAVVALGVVILGVVAAASAFVVSTTTVQGDTASVGYALSALK